MAGKLKLPTRSGSAPKQEETPQGGRRMVEVNGVPVWLDSSTTSETTAPSGISEEEQTRQQASRIKRMLGISDT